MTKLLYRLMAVGSVLAVLSSCEKSYMDEIDSISPKLYLTPVQAGVIALTKEKISFNADSSVMSVSLGVARSGTQKGSSSTVSVTTETRDLPAGTEPLPSIILKQTQVVIPADSGAGIFQLQIPVSVLKSNLGKKLATRLSISNPTNYELNAALSSAIILLDVNNYYAAPPPPNPLPKYVIIDEKLADNWGNWGWDKTVDYSSAEQKLQGSKSAKVEYTGDWGGFQVHAPDGNLNMAAYKTLKISIYGSTNSDGKTVKLSLSQSGAAVGEKTLTLKKDQFTTFTIPLAELGSPATLSDIHIQNQGTAGLVMYIDGFGFD
jgi:hypothetical protein